MSSKKSKNEKDTLKRLFIISPIGQPNSETRIYFDKMRKHIIEPVASEKGYKTSRADNISRPGRITKQIIERLREDDLVIADLTEKNPNVFYELAVRHAVGKPVILMGAIGEDIPFDVAAQRVIFYDLDPDNIVEAKLELARQISAVESDRFIVDSPIESPIPLEQARTVGTERERSDAILENLSLQVQRIQEIVSRVYPQPISSLQTRARKASQFYNVVDTLRRDADYKLTEKSYYNSLKESAITESIPTFSFERFQNGLMRMKKPVKLFFDVDELILWYVEGKYLISWHADSRR